MKYFYLLFASILLQFTTKGQEVEFKNTFELPDAARKGQFKELKYNGIDDNFKLAYWTKPFDNLPSVSQVTYSFDKEFNFIKEEKSENKVDINLLTKDTSTYLLFPSYLSPENHINYKKQYVNLLKKATIESYQLQFVYDENKKKLKSESKLIKNISLNDANGDVLKFIYGIGQSKKNDDYFVCSKSSKVKNKEFFLHRINKRGSIVHEKKITFSEEKLPIFTKLLLEGKDEPKEYIVIIFAPYAEKKDSKGDNQKYSIYCFDDKFNEFSNVSFLSETLSWRIQGVEKMNNDLFFFGSGDTELFSGDNAIQIMRVSGSEIKYSKKFMVSSLNEKAIFPDQAENAKKNKLQTFQNLLFITVTDDGEMVVSGNNYFYSLGNNYFSSYLFNFSGTGELKALYHAGFSPLGKQMGRCIAHQVVYEKSSGELLWLTYKLEKVIETPDQIMTTMCGDKTNQTDILCDLYIASIDNNAKKFNTFQKINGNKNDYISFNLFAAIPQPFSMDKKFLFPGMDDDGKQFFLYKINLNKYAKIEKLEDYILNLSK